MLRQTRRMALFMESMMLMLAKDRRRLSGNTSLAKVRVSSRPSRIDQDRSDPFCSKRRARSPSRRLSACRVPMPVSRSGDMMVGGELADNVVSLPGLDGHAPEGHMVERTGDLAQARPVKQAPCRYRAGCPCATPRPKTLSSRRACTSLGHNLCPLALNIGQQYPSGVWKGPRCNNVHYNGQ